jgi:hypothetical protein
MARCTTCDVEVLGDWSLCPLCRSPLTGAAPVPTDDDPLPRVPLKFTRRGLARALLAASLVVIAASLAAQLLMIGDRQPVGWFRSVWLGVTCMWLLVMTALHKRRNIAKAALYLTVLVSGVCAYWDFLTGWHRWSLTYAVPIVCAGAAIAVLIIVRIMRMETGDHILYTGAVSVLGVVPVLFVLFGWSNNPWAGVISACGSGMVLLSLPTTGGRTLWAELTKRFHV